MIPIPNDGKGNLDDPKNYWSVYTAIDGDTMEVAWQVLVDGNLDNTDCRLSGQVRVLELLQSQQGHHPCRNDRPRAGVGGRLQHQAHRRGGQERRLQGDQRRQGGRRPARIEIHALHSDPELPAWRQYRAGRHPRRDQRQAVADRQRHRRAQARRSVRRQDQGARRRRRRAGARPRSACTPPSMGSGNAFTTAVHRQPDGEVEHRQGQDAPSRARRSIRSCRRWTSTISPATTTPPWAKPRKPTASGSCRSTSSPRTDSFTVGPLQAEQRPADRHLRR